LGKQKTYELKMTEIRVNYSA